ncbi:MAG: hypothetical protein H6707_10855 [Deltaproteobacteria bacterium]|nr:hypothetical protein [Deltaproteobacteria bacterium]
MRWLLPISILIASVASVGATPRWHHGSIAYSEPSGSNLYLELKTASGKVIGVELLPQVRRVWSVRLAQGQQIAVRGKQLKGDKSVAFVIEVDQLADIKLAGGKRRRLVGAAVTRSAARGPVVTLAGIGLWPPVTSAIIEKKIVRAHRDGVKRLVIDVGLTERWRSYQNPAPALEVIARATRIAKRLGLKTAFYFPSFELRREGWRGRGARLSRLAAPWAQHWHGGGPVYLTRFTKQEFWNKPGDEALWVCPNSPWRARFAKLLIAAAQRGVETFFVDVPYFRASGKRLACGCRHCRRQLLQRTGQPLGALRQSPAGRLRLLRWRQATIRRFLAELRAQLRRVNRRARLVVEEYPSSVKDGPRQTGFEAGELRVGDVDWLAHEYSAQQGRAAFDAAAQRDLLLTLKLYRGLDGTRPSWVLSYARTVAESQRSAAIHLAAGTSFWETKAPEMTDSSVSYAWRRRLNAWLSAYHKDLAYCRSVANVAVVYSSRSRLVDEKHFYALRETQRLLHQHNIAYHVVPIGDASALRRYPMILLPQLTVLDPVELRTLSALTSRLVAIGSSPAGLRAGRSARSAMEAVATIDSVPVIVEGGPLLAQICRGPQGALDLRLVNTAERPQTARIRLTGKARKVQSLPFLGKWRGLGIKRDGSQLIITTPVRQMQVVRVFQ